MASLFRFALSLLTSTLRTRLSLQLEIAALRHQLSLYQSKGRRPRIAPADRLLWSVVADRLGISSAMWLIAALAFVSGLFVFLRMRETNAGVLS